MIAPVTAATPALSGLFAARGGATALNMGSGYFLRPERRNSYGGPSYSPPPSYQPAAPQPPQYAPQAPQQGYAPPPQSYAPPPQQGYAPQPVPGQGYIANPGAPAQDAGDLPSSGWGGEAKAHSRDPTPTQLDPNDPKSKQTHIPQSESFEEYMRRRQMGY